MPPVPPLPGTVDLAICQSTDRAWGLVSAGETVTVTVEGTQMGATLSDGNGFFWTTLYDGDGNRPRLSGGETVAIYHDGVQAASGTLRSIVGSIDVVNDTVSGTIGGSGFPIDVTVYVATQEPSLLSYSQTVSTNEFGSFTADFSGILDLLPWNQAQVAYVENDIEVHAHVYPGPSLSAYPPFLNWVEGTAPAGTLLTATVYYPDWTMKVSGTMVADPTSGFYSWEVPDDLLEGEVVVVDMAGGWTLSRTIETLSLSVDAASDQVTGRAEPGQVVRGRASHLTPDGWRDVTLSTTADPTTGEYLLDFSIAADIKPGWWAGVFAADAEGDDLGLWAPTPSVAVHQTWNDVWGRGPSPPGGDSEGRVISLTLASSPEVYTTKMDRWASYYFDQGGYGLPDIGPGEIVTVATEGYPWLGVVEVKSLTVQHDVDADQFTGTAEPPSDWVELSGRQWSGWGMIAPLYPVGGLFDTRSDLDSPFLASPAGFDVRNAVGYDVGHRTADDYLELIYGEVDYVRVWPQSNGALAHFGPPGTTYTLTLRAGDGTFKGQITGVSTEPTGWAGWNDFWSEGVEMEPGDLLLAKSAAGFDQTIRIPELTLEVDEVNDVISGAGPANALLFVDVNDEDLGFVPTNSGGQFAVVADQFQQVRNGDIKFGDWVTVCYINEDANHICWDYYWPQVRMDVNYAHDWVEVQTLPGATITVTVAGKGMVSGEADSGGWFRTYDWPWDPDQPQIEPGDVIIATGIGLTSMVDPVGEIVTQMDSGADTVSGTIHAPWFDSVTVRCEIWEEGGSSIEIPDVYANGGSYFCDFSGEWDIGPWTMVAVKYLEPDGDTVINIAQPLDLLLRVNYGRDWVEGNYEPGHTLWLTVTEGDGSTVKATAELQTQEIPWWGGQTGFSTNLDNPWVPERPDIQAFDYVYGEMNNGYTSTVRLGTITGELDVDADSIEGTITADWFTEMLYGSCSVWEDGGPWDDFPVDPKGGSYFCDFGEMGWDLKPGHQVGVEYYEPDGDTVINVFETPWMRVNYGHDWVGGNYPAGHTFWITVTDSLDNPKGYAVTQSTPGRGWGGEGFETRDEDWLGLRPDIEPYDLVHLRSDDGYHHTIQVGEIVDDLDMVENTIAGTITADWFDETLEVRCSVWVDNGPGDIQTTAQPDGGSFTCDFDDVGWDLQPGQTVAVQYREPDDGDRIINTFRGPAPDMRVEKWADGNREALAGGLAVFSIRYRNEGDDTAETVIMTDTLDPDMHYVADSSKDLTPVFDGKQVIWTLGPVDPGEDVHFQLVVSNTASAGETLFNHVQIWTEYDYEDWDNEAEADIYIRADGAPDVYVNKSAEPNDPVPGGTYLYEIDYGNNGPVATGPVVLTDTLPSVTRIVGWYSEEGYGLWTDYSTANQLILKAPTLPANWQDRIVLRVKVNPGVVVGTPLANEVELAIPADHKSYQHDNAQVGQPRWNSHLNKNFDGGMLVPGGEVYYNVHVRNFGNLPTQTWLTDTLPAGTRIAQVWRWDGQQNVEFPPDFEDGQTVVWDLGGMLPGQWYDVNMQLDIDHGVAPGTELENCVELGIDGPDGWPYDNADCVVDAVRGYGPNVRLSKDYEWHWDGDTDYRIEYEIHFENLGTETLYGVDIVDTLPAGTYFTGNWWDTFWRGITFNQAGNQLTWTLEELQPSERSRINFEVGFSPAPDQGQQFVNRVVAPILDDVYPDDNSAEVTAATGPDVYVKKWLSGGQARPGGIVTFTVEFGNRNQWPWDGSGNSRIVDTLPPEMTFVTATNPDDPSQEWLPNIIGNKLEWEWGTMWNNSWWRFDLVVEIADTVGAGDVLVNRIEAWSPADWDADESNNTFDLPLTIESARVYLPVVLRNH